MGWWRSSRTVACSSLNPYSNGRYSMGFLKELMRALGIVLILILMEDTLWAKKYVNVKNISSLVLILILMEDTLWVLLVLIEHWASSRLNPYSNGRYSMG